MGILPTSAWNGKYLATQPFVLADQVWSKLDGLKKPSKNKDLRNTSLEKGQDAPKYNQNPSNMSTYKVHTRVHLVEHCMKFLQVLEMSKFQISLTPLNVQIIKTFVLNSFCWEKTYSFEILKHAQPFFGSQAFQLGGF